MLTSSASAILHIFVHDISFNLPALRLETFASLLESIVIFKIAFDSFFFPLYGYRLGLIPSPPFKCGIIKIKRLGNCYVNESEI